MLCKMRIHWPFRDIDLSKEGTKFNGEDDDWDPKINYQGNMEGQKGTS